MHSFEIDKEIRRSLRRKIGTRTARRLSTKTNNIASRRNRKELPKAALSRSIEEHKQWLALRDFCHEQ